MWFEDSSDKSAVSRLIIFRVLAQFDASLVEHLLAQPALISVVFTAQLGPFIGNLKLDGAPAPVGLVAEGQRVIMMSQAICDARGDCQELLAEICPHLPKSIVFRVLRDQAVDDFHPRPNDTGLFEAFMASELQGSHPLIPTLERSSDNH
jgi:hypothetical protein